MAGSITSGSISLTPSAVKATLSSNYISTFDLLDQYLPDLQEQEFARYGERTIKGFLEKMSAEMPSNSDLIRWTEEGRLHTKYTSVSTTAAVSSGQQTFDIGASNHNFRLNETVILSSASEGKAEKAIIVDIAPGSPADPTRFTVAYYSAVTPGFADPTTDIIVFVYGSEFKKGDNGMQGSLEAETEVFSVKPVIIKDRFEIAGSDMAQIGWVEVETDQGLSYLWYLKSKSDTRKRYDDKLEMMMIEHVDADPSSGVDTYFGTSGTWGSMGLFESIETRGNVWSGGTPSTLADFDDILEQLDGQGAIAENTLFVNRAFALAIDDMLAAQNSYGVGGTSYGLFDNNEKMALNLGFTGFRRGSYDFYKTDWKYLNDATTRGGLVGGKVNGVLVPAGTMNVYDEVMGKRVSRPFLHVRYRASETENRKYKTWITGSAGGATNSDVDAMYVNFLSERALCTLGANNFFIFE
jgi:hypothetical protein